MLKIKNTNKAPVFEANLLKMKLDDDKLQGSGGEELNSHQMMADTDDIKQDSIVENVSEVVRVYHVPNSMNDHFHNYKCLVYDEKCRFYDHHN